MKKMITTLCLVGALCAFSQDNQTPPARREGPRRGEFQKLTPEQRKERMEKFRAEIKARRDATQKKVVSTLMEAGLDEAKAKDTAEKIEKIYLEGRRMRPGMGGPRGFGMGGRGNRAPRARQKSNK
jgi:acyl-CoA reductase-like NAD-dependent aldehyde dehydrogenase